MRKREGEIQATRKEREEREGNEEEEIERDKGKNLFTKPFYKKKMYNPK